MVHINTNESDRVPPFEIVILDAMDMAYLADVMEDRMYLFDTLEDYGIGVALADALFVTKNYGWKSLQAMNELDAGYDVRVYNKNNACIYAAHTRFKEHWIGKQ